MVAAGVHEIVVSDGALLREKEELSSKRGSEKRMFRQRKQPGQSLEREENMVLRGKESKFR